MRLQNAIAALVFVILFLGCISMQLLTLFPANSTLWYLNVTYAREIRPVLELLDELPFAGLTQNGLIVLALIGLCAVAARRNSTILTSATTHLALYAVIFSGIASYSRAFGNLQAASLSVADMADLANTLDQGQLALTLILAVMLVTCMYNHYQIISGLVGDKLAASYRDRSLWPL